MCSALHSLLHSVTQSLRLSDGCEKRQQLWDIDIVSLTVSLLQEVMLPPSLPPQPHSPHSLLACNYWKQGTLDLIHFPKQMVASTEMWKYVPRADCPNYLKRWRDHTVSTPIHLTNKREEINAQRGCVTQI